MRINLDAVPLRDSSLSPEEILMSESQERMIAVVAPGDVDRFREICAKWDVEATDIGEVTSTGRLVVDWHGETVVDVPPRTVAHEGPVYERPYAPPADQEALATPAAERLLRPRGGPELRETLLRLVASPNLADKSWITDQYDRYVRGNTVLAQPDDAGVVRVDEGTGLGVAVATDGNARFVRLDPYAGTQLALAEAYRNVGVAGARPVAVTDCLNFGSPQDPGVMWQFERATAGLADGCRALGIPVTGGNVSFYNQTGDAPILPTPVVGVLGVHDDVARRVPTGFRVPGQLIYLLGTTYEELSGSEWASVVHGHLGGTPPRVDLTAEHALADLLVACARDGLVAAAHDVADGGLAQALVESCLRHGLGASVSLPDDLDPFVALFSESSARAIVAVPPEAEARFGDLCATLGVPHRRIGVVSDQPALNLEGLFAIPLGELRAAWSATIPATMA
jgi:phosphoribosylformylglycinamidine synthase